MQKKLTRIGTDIAGYGLILLGIVTGWLPGPGGIPLILAGLSLLSVHNRWAKRLREWLITKSSDAAEKLFPDNRLVQFLYDTAAVALLVFSAVLIWKHSAIGHISLAILGFTLCIVLASFNKERFQRLKNLSHKSTP